MNVEICTAASEKYAKSLCALLGSLEANWPAHPRITIYDLGLSHETRTRLQGNGYSLVGIPEFCPHWRKHYTWKLWILKNASADIVLWMDAGLLVLRPLFPIIEILKIEPYFLVPNYQSLAREAPPACVYSLGLTYAELRNRSSISGNVMGFNKYGGGAALVERAYELALNEDIVKATSPAHRHDQALMSCLLYSEFGDIKFYDGMIYAAWASAAEVAGQRCWGHRRQATQWDVEQLSLRTCGFAGGYIPRDPRLDISWHQKSANYLKSKAARLFKGVTHHGVR